MTTRRLMSLTISGLAMTGALAVSLQARQQAAKPAMGHDMPMQGAMTHDGMPMSKAEKIANAMTAAPAARRRSGSWFDRFKGGGGGRRDVIRPRARH